MSALWTPPGSLHRGRAQLPLGDVRLGDGKLAKRDQDDLALPADVTAGVWRVRGGLLIIGGVEPTRFGVDLLHVSMSRQDRDPSWPEICAVKDGFYGDRDCMMVLPREYDYVNLHPHAFHLWETPEAWGMQ